MIARMMKKQERMKSKGCVSYLLPLYSPPMKKDDKSKIEIATKKTPACEKGA